MKTTLQRRSLHHNKLMVTFLLNICLFTIASGFQWLLISESKIEKFKPVTDEFCQQENYLTLKQTQVCAKHKDMMSSIADGVSLALKECQNQFRNESWNCSSRIEPKRLNAKRTSDLHTSVFRHEPQSGTRESAFVHAITSAGVVTVVTKNCRSGLIENCGCDLSWPTRNSYHASDFEWGGCSANVAWGQEMARVFVDASERRESKKKRSRNRKMRKRVANEKPVNLKNNQIGRQIVDELVEKQCKCHGVSSACDLKTCWRTLPDFSRVANHLKDGYNTAVQVHVVRKKERTVIQAKKGEHPVEGHRKLVFLRRTKSFCHTQGRVCFLDRDTSNSCENLCCNRGYHTIIREHVTSCNCKFKWCCEVTCQSCFDNVTENICL